MGAWGHGPFDNDEAGDFVDEFEREGAAAVQRALAATGDVSYLEAPEASMAVAAAAFVAAAVGHTQWLPEDAQQAFSAKPGGLFIQKDQARAAIDRVLAPDSELLELWEEAGGQDLTSFTETLQKLRASLS